MYHNEETDSVKLSFHHNCMHRIKTNTFCSYNMLWYQASLSTLGETLLRCWGQRTCHGVSTNRKKPGFDCYGLWNIWFDNIDNFDYYLINKLNASCLLWRSNLSRKFYVTHYLLQFTLQWTYAKGNSHNPCDYRMKMFDLHLARKPRPLLGNHQPLIWKT